MVTETYSRRLLSPFHGLQQVISVEGGIAESMDGWNWKLYVADESIVSHTGLSEIVYGSWNPYHGLSRSRIRGAMPSSIIEQMGDRLLQAVERHADSIPFASLDEFELWLLDEESGKPLALLDSALADDTLGFHDNPTWHPGGQAGRGFCSESGNAEDLIRLIKRASGKPSAAVWIKRKRDGTGSDQYGAHYPSRMFPALLLRERWEDIKQQQLVSDFLKWQAPWLLQLPLNPETRVQLEEAAWDRPFETSRVYRLFPEIIDEKGLTTTRVKARMMRHDAPAQQVKEPFYPFVNE
ncbi:MAG: hypothetical protein AB2728_15460 [Candidatus Thiodiazotropha sp.]|nr:hypothetical protein [Candidatus Thiodiazotropha taylori]MBT3059746.1 hypothetical protein [Candidatus Thiodiazotropha sp. (ex Lucina pensylvanica)]MBT3063147.1 hypothetical protein [Candidatus Thiodiazotropha sp. (ex Lucina pensylvanica)]MBV2093839.1 hypothetical protein [Candidatus Thiodiazotropha sp. (ex Codakia orbicularis)]PUB72390.1 MAG: hypothetical protein DBP03_17195 [gamma proteobacterium symbiont of Ctena orbiculata]